jgi:hypothetical protein
VFRVCYRFGGLGNLAHPEAREATRVTGELSQQGVDEGRRFERGEIVGPLSETD